MTRRSFLRNLGLKRTKGFTSDHAKLVLLVLVILLDHVVLEALGDLLELLLVHATLLASRELLLLLAQLERLEDLRKRPGIRK